MNGESYPPSVYPYNFSMPWPPYGVPPNGGFPARCASAPCLRLSMITYLTDDFGGNSWAAPRDFVVRHRVSQFQTKGGISFWDLGLLRGKWSLRVVRW